MFDVPGFGCCSPAVKSLHVCVLSHSSCVRFFATPWTVSSLPGSSIHGIIQARILEWVAISSFRGSS